MMTATNYLVTNFLLFFLLSSYVCDAAGSYGLGFYISGKPSAKKNAAQSRAMCPEGFYASECYCHDSNNCGGSGWPNPGNQRLCVAYNRAGAKRPTIAIAKCQSAAYLTIKIVRAARKHGQGLRCPKGFTMDGCSRADRWSHRRSVTEAIRRVDANNNVVCVWNQLGKNDFAKQPTVSAVCIKDACPDCEDIFNSLFGKLG